MPGPERRLREVVAVLGQPDALEPDDQDELEPAAAHRREQRREVAGREGADPEQVEVEHRLVDAQLDHAEDGEQREAADQRREHERRRPAHRVPAVGLDPVRDPDHHADEAERRR